MAELLRHWTSALSGTLRAGLIPGTDNLISYIFFLNDDDGGATHIAGERSASVDVPE